MRVSVLWASSSLVTLALLGSACGDSSDAGGSGGGSSKAKVTDAQIQAALDNYASNIYAAYSDSVTDQAAFSASVETLLTTPNDQTLGAARTAWLASRAHYMLTEGGRFYDGPIDIDPPNHEAAINSWPLDEAYIDYTTDKATMVVDQTTGFVNHPDLMPDITIDALDMANAQGGDDNISNGYHAEEFLLWGQALVDVGPGTRPASDFLATGAHKNSDRRSTYLRVSAAGVTQHLTAIRDAWAPSADYRTTFTKGGLASVALAFTGLGKFSKGELAGQRINAPYASKSRRDQHDCFSSLTLDDYLRDAQGVQNMYLGNYGTNDGPGLDTLVAVVDPALDAKIKAQIQTSIDAMLAIPKPFEASIAGDDSSEGRTAIRAVVASLRAQGDLFADAASALGVQIVVPDDND